MFDLAWDQTGERLYETGVDRVVLYIDGAGYPWNGVTSITDHSSGGEETKLFADNNKYLGIISIEDVSFDIECYTYPEEFVDCIGNRCLVPGLYIGQQRHTKFGLSYRTFVGDQSGLNNYKIHVFYNCLCTPSEKQNSTVNDSPEVSTYSWSINTHSESINNFKNSSKITFDTRTLDPIYTHEIERILYGSNTSSSRLPSINDLIHVFDNEYWYLNDSSDEYIVDSNGLNIIGFGMLD